MSQKITKYHGVAKAISNKMLVLLRAWQFKVHGAERIYISAPAVTDCHWAGVASTQNARLS